jgi:hypothetical protein
MAGPIEWSPKGRGARSVLDLVKPFERAHPFYKGWAFDFQYPGFFVYRHPTDDVSIFFTPDWSKKGEVDVQVNSNDEPIETETFPFVRNRTAQRLFEIVRPFLDKYGPDHPPSLGSIPERLLLVRPESGSPLREFLEKRFGKEAGSGAYFRIVRRIGEEPAVELGSGEKGTAWGLPSGKVLKATADADELRAMALLREVRHPNLVRVFDAFVVPADASGIGIVVREAVDEVLAETGRYKELDTLLWFGVAMAGSRYDSARAEGLSQEQALLEGMHVFRDLLTGEFSERLFAHEKALVPGIKEGIRELERLGILSIDFGPKNIGLSDGRPVLFDISLAWVPKDKVEIA